MLLAKTLRSSTFKLALIAIGTFGVIVSAIFSYVYLSTCAYVRSRSDRAITNEYQSLQAAYQRSGRDGLIALIARRVGDPGFAGDVYILADPASTPLAGNLTAWPSTAAAAAGWIEFRAPEPQPGATRAPLLRARFQTLPGGERLLAGRDISELDSLTDRIEMAAFSGVALIFVLAGVASVLVTRARRCWSSRSLSAWRLSAMRLPLARPS